jgi:hypothetical protein
MSRRGSFRARPVSRLSWEIRYRTLAPGFVTTAMRDSVHLLALRAGALHVGKTKAGAMTTAQADVTVLRSAEHATELAAQDTIGTAYDHFRHFLRTLLPLFFMWRARSGPMFGGDAGCCHLAGEARNHHVPTQSCLRREPATIKEPLGKRKWPESRGVSHDGARFAFGETARQKWDNPSIMFCADWRPHGHQVSSHQSEGRETGNFHRRRD